MIPARFANVLFGFLLSGMMSLIVSGISTFRAAGLSDGLFGLWMSSWAPSWMVAFPSVLLVAPFTRRLVARLIKP
ncbi:DUF2798 domain-containing protein [Yoonia sp.]|uniref:DUF2798 domain-containing protein n=1 Tax=Yoonia sp. TaxID=2212373 RepID=UPI0019F38A57|nr:DUF2798 domain-containing protein [Yoonia sp.]MBE0412173.1 DUF2798 domain-containing protein [Yoonia sp.]